MMKTNKSKSQEANTTTSNIADLRLSPSLKYITQYLPKKKQQLNRTLFLCTSRVSSYLINMNK